MADGPAPRLAVDLGGTTTRVALVQGTRIQRREEMPTCAEDGPDRLIDRLIQLVTRVQASPSAPIGVACTGRVHGGRVTAVNAGTMPGWTGVPLGARLAETLGVPVHVLNDARAATLGEWHARGAGEAQNFMFVTVSTGIGSGLILRGRLHDPSGGHDVGLGFTRGLNGEALEFGTSGRGLDRTAHNADYAGVAGLFDAAERGDRRAQEVLRAPLSALADRLHDAHCLLGLDIICLGGSVGLRTYTREVLAAAFAGPGNPELQPAHHGPDAGLIGAALHAAQKEMKEVETGASRRQLRIEVIEAQ